MIFAGTDFVGVRLLICSTQVLFWESDNFRFAIRKAIHM